MVLSLRKSENYCQNMTEFVCIDNMYQSVLLLGCLRADKKIRDKKNSISKYFQQNFIFIP